MIQKKYNKNQEISVAIDCVIIGYDQKKLSVLLFQRQVEPFKGSWSLLGEVPDAKTSMDKSAQDIIYKLTGAKDIYLSQLKTYGDLDRDPLERVLSIVYYSLIRVDVFKKIDLKKYNAKWFDLNVRNWGVKTSEVGKKLVEGVKNFWFSKFGISASICTKNQ